MSRQPKSPSVKVLGLPARLLNALLNGGVRTVDEAVNARAGHGRKIRGLGPASWDLIDRAINAHSSVKASIEPTAVEHEARPVSVQRVVEAEAYSTGPAASMRAGLDAALASFGERDRLVFFLRTGREGAIPTLDDVGAQLGVTRERARQIWQRSLDRLAHEPWMIKSLGKIQAILDVDQVPVYLDLLGVLDPWFAGFEHELDFLAQVLEAVSDQAVRTLNLRGRIVLSRLTPSLWHDLTRTAVDTLRAQLPTKLTKLDIAVTLEALARHAGVRALAGELGAELEERLHFVSDGVSGVEYLSGIGQSRRAVVASILARAAAPLSLTEIREEYTTLTQATTSLVSLRAAIVHAGGFPYSGRRYGLRAHLPLTPAEQDTLCDFAESLMTKAGNGRQWHTQELADEAARAHPEWEDRIDAYIVDIVLHAARGLDDLGRQTWGIRGGVARSTDDRIGIAELCVAVLRESGRAMHYEEIHAAVSKRRGLRFSLQLSPNAHMVRLGRGMWGLTDRDTGLTREQREEVLSLLLDKLSSRGRGLHFTELSGALGLELPAEPEIVWGLAEQDERFKVGRGQYIGLSTWESVNRLTIQEAVDAALPPDAERVSLPAFIRQVEGLLGRSPPTESVRGALRERGFYHDPRSGDWVLSIDLST